MTVLIYPKTTTDYDTTFFISQRLVYLSDLTFLSRDTLNSWPFCKQLGHCHQAGSAGLGWCARGGLDNGLTCLLTPTARCSVWSGAEWAISQGKAWYRFSKPAYLTPSSFLSPFLWADSPRVLQVCWLYQYNVLHLEFAYQCDVAVLSIMPIHHHCCMNCLVGTSRFDKTK